MGTGLLYGVGADRASELHEALWEYFGTEAHLLVGCQPLEATIFFAERPGLVITTLGSYYTAGEPW